MGSDSLAPEEIEELRKRHIRSFVMRRGHISKAESRALDETFPRYEVRYGKVPFDARAAFGRESPLVLEIGCGMGETTAAIAAANPGIDFLGCEVFAAGIGALAKRLGEEGIDNVRIVRHDAVDVVHDMIPEGRLAGIHVFFPDPWRKARHHKRRLIKQPFVHELALRLAPGGYIHCATDWEDYAVQMLEVLSGEPLLADWKGEGYSPVAENPLCGRPRTKFQARGERLGHLIRDLVYVRRAP